MAWLFQEPDEGLFAQKSINRIVIQIKAGKMNLIDAIKPLLLEVAIAQEKAMDGQRGVVLQDVALSPPQRKMFEKVLRPFFASYTTKKNAIAINEFNRVFMDMGEKKVRSAPVIRCCPRLPAFTRTLHDQKELL